MAFIGELYPFQTDARDRMLERRKMLLAFYMGLGKTPTTIAVIEDLLDEQKVETGLVIVPASLKYQWLRQIQKFTADATVLVIDGTPKQRYAQYEIAGQGEYEYIILTYDQVVIDWAYVSRLRRDYVVCDEITAIKSFRAKRSRRVKRLQAEYIYGLSGQPIENIPEEGYSIMQMIDDTVLGRFDLFDRTFIKRNSYGGVKYYRNLKKFHHLMSEAMVRRTREEVSDQLPAVTETTRYIDFDRRGAVLYRKMSRDLLLELAAMAQTYGTWDIWNHYNSLGNPALDAARGQVMSKLTCIRMLCDHPELLRRSAKLFWVSGEDGVDGYRGGSSYAAELAVAGELDPLRETPKMKDCLSLISEILDENPVSKVVLFSFFKSNLEILQKELISKKIQSVQYHGGMSAQVKDEMKMRFDSDSQVRVFLSSDAGGYGVDLPIANYLINYDLPWSNGKLEQRNARIVRLSSEFPEVTVINLLMRGSIEERQYALLVQKRAVASAIIDGRGIDKQGRLTLTLATLTSFLTESSV